VGLKTRDRSNVRGLFRATLAAWVNSAIFAFNGGAQLADIFELVRLLALRSSLQ